MLKGTIAVELLEQVDHLDAVIVPVGGGGLIAGIATYIQQVKPSCKGMYDLNNVILTVFKLWPEAFFNVVESIISKPLSTVSFRVV